MFSVIGMICLSLLGYTHIRKDFGEKTGIIYFFFFNNVSTSNIII